MGLARPEERWKNWETGCQKTGRVWARPEGRPVFLKRSFWPAPASFVKAFLFDLFKSMHNATGEPTCVHVDDAVHQSPQSNGH